MRVKICGLTQAEDAALAVELGADAVGFIFWPKSPRVTTIANVRAIGRSLPGFVTRVGVFVNAPPDEVAATAAEAGLDAVQLHGDEDVAQYAGISARLIKGLPLDDDAAVQRVIDLPAEVTPLVDAADRDRRGGTGRLADWSRAARVAAQRPIVLAGGLSADNVTDAIRQVRPWAIDVSSGVEDAPGVKNAARMRQLFDVLARVRAEGL
ncbi:MAG TPA: phosphoribosylanthranilate isomerase [Vicinamibacterales bacterium]|jgi:phosphoribosylanthranilate isomerase|nr:phosphoribosylanthranilate isomerase [Vicinamibacterales bacterium]